MTERLVRIHPLFDRSWHWLQAPLIFALFASGRRVIGRNEAMPFGLALLGHVGAAILLMVPRVFAIFRHLTAGTRASRIRRP